MTYSLIAKDPKTNALGLVTATGNLAVGGFVPHLCPGVGAIATQGFSTNYWYGVNGLKQLENDENAESVVKNLTDADTGRDYRQMLLLDAKGNGAAWTGHANTAHHGHIIAPNLVAGGNILASDDVIPAMQSGFERALKNGVSFSRALLCALKAAFEAGGDKRGTSSAVIRVVTPNALPLDLRIDDHAQPIAELHRLYDMTQQNDYQSFFVRLPTPDHPHQY
tara:strand:- start:46006 stop:46671 length:666 start_codon:yes stop_codon:yes gene_type:complete